ncbi:IS110-like element ISSpu22 family transposase [Shewanella sp. JNE10-2]|uniref:IS110-like element ISSpu22 family transposase n=1 Tax=unclassified Shewanella TaxID=196818 RepID=UPI00200371ED|nr:MULTISPECIES: IS110-like element ISSpu22 family transposase [unclassified Shewanella]MCK7632334.1 IS110-like element ISSpu22 family transposase [Shewanella sp. JNE9-1]MCK7647494.1 IS110-like element ISSpu22 family transposase [Shewanella sp. JNE3-1]MCK7655638.1 IS110-like element ISSpu22 family transposase [Shewanella sp. JNE4-1]UPO27321.1 IS110-like element ISSpu22 family transposase [Shewanella sp. JNE10-2]UPO27710.1 IS110-like element ISSpu22 family transposase [Shewanella sp. JNE10-2]
MKITTIGLDIAKSVFHLVGVDKAGKLIKKKILRRKDLLPFVAKIEPCLIVMEACGGASYWAREFEQFGHIVKLIAPQYVVPFRQGNKNDYNDALAIAEAAQRPNMRFVKPKSVEQQDVQLLHRMRERLTKQSTALINQVRGMLAEYGIVMTKSKSAFKAQLPDILIDEANTLTTKGRAIFYQLYDEVIDIEKRLKSCDTQVLNETQNNVICQRLQTIPGVGPVTATAIYAAVGDGKDFSNGRHFSAWCGLVPKQHSSGGKDNLLGISKRGNAYLRTLFIHGARAVLRHSGSKSDKLSCWAIQLAERRGFNRACVAVANKLARMSWVIAAREEEFRLAM